MLKIWDKKSNLILPDGIERTPEEIFANPSFAFTKHVATVIETAGPITMAIDNLYILMQVYDIDESLAEVDALAAIVAARAVAKQQEAQA